jgi:8-oxo-dGTP pyrophosphatase MutT (NUDIX family)
MSDFSDSYLGQLRKVIGNRLVLMPGTRVVIENPLGQVLLDRRADFGTWALPGGCAETGEAIEATIVREVLEESGMVLHGVTPFGFASDPVWETTTFPNGDVCQNFSLLFTASDYSRKPRPLDGEALEYRWSDPLDLPEMVTNHRRTVEAWVRWRSGAGFQLI